MHDSVVAMQEYDPADANRPVMDLADRVPPATDIRPFAFSPTRGLVEGGDVFGARASATWRRRCPPVVAPLGDTTLPAAPRMWCTRLATAAPATVPAAPRMVTTAVWAAGMPAVLSPALLPGICFWPGLLCRSHRRRRQRRRRAWWPGCHIEPSTSWRRRCGWVWVCRRRSWSCASHGVGPRLSRSRSAGWWSVEIEPQNQNAGRLVPLRAEKPPPCSPYTTNQPRSIVMPESASTINPATVRMSHAAIARRT